MTNPIPTPIPNPQSPIPGPRTRANRANARHSTGPRTEPGKQRSSLNALRHGLPRPTDPDGTSRGTEIQERSKGVPATARTALLPTEDPEAYQRHIQQFLEDCKPANAPETQLVHEMANIAWRLNRIPYIEAELLSQASDPQIQIPLLARLGLHGARLSRQFQKALDQLRDIQEGRHRLERRHLNEVGEILIRHQRKGLPFDPAVFSKEAGFVFSKEQIECYAQHLIHLNPAYYAMRTSLQTPAGVY